MADSSTRRLRTACYNCCNKSIPDLAAFRLEYPPKLLHVLGPARKTCENRSQSPACCTSFSKECASCCPAFKGALSRSFAVPKEGRKARRFSGNKSSDLKSAKRRSAREDRSKVRPLPNRLHIDNHDLNRKDSITDTYTSGDCTDSARASANLEIPFILHQISP